MSITSDYRRHLERRGLSPRTVLTRTYTVRRFSNALGGLDLAEATADDVREFLESPRIGVRCRYSYLSSLASFYGWAVEEGHLEADPTTRVERPKLPKSLPRPAHDSDLDEALALLRPNVRAMVALAAYAGLRCCEIAGIHGDHIMDHDGHTVLLVTDGKGAKERMVPLHPTAVAAMRRHGLPKSGPVFHYRGEPHRQLTPARVSLMANRALKEIGVTSTMHQFRHWFGTRLYRATRDIRGVGEVMGHSSPVSTAIYTKFDVSTIVEDVNAL